MSSRAETARSLLRIDFVAALDKLAWAQMQGTWQLPAELARLAIACGARRVDLEISPRRLALAAPGARLSRRAVSDFAAVLDRGLGAAERHAAMVGLEERGAFVLSAVAGLELRSLTLRTGGADGLGLVLRDGALEVRNPAAPPAERPELELAVDGLGIDARKAAKWLRRAARFAEVPVAVGGVPVERGFDAPLIEQHLVIAPPAGGRLAGTLAIPRRGHAPRLWLLRHGIVATRATVPGFPAFEAAIEMGDAAGAAAPDTGGAALRERLDAYVETVVDAAVGLVIALGSEAATLPEKTRARVARLLLEAAKKRRRLAEVSGVRVFPLVETRGRSWVSIDLVGRLVRVEAQGACALDAIPPGRDPKGFALEGRPALAISEGERALLGELLRVVFSTPPARLRRRRGRRWLERLAEMAPLWRAGRPVEGSELSPGERAFLERLREAGGIAAEFRTGAGRARRTGDGVLLLPRSNARVRACVEAVDRDPVWLYPAILSLLAGRELPGPEARRLWLREALGA